MARTIVYVTVSKKYAVSLDLPEGTTDDDLYEEACTRIDDPHDSAPLAIDADTTLESIDRPFGRPAGAPS